jgi:hypothetical protein
MYGSIVLLHVIGFALFILIVLPAHYRFFGIGLSVTAYTLGLRHAFDADHISAIDNTTRKAMNERQGTSRPRAWCVPGPGRACRPRHRTSRRLALVRGRRRRGGHCRPGGAVPGGRTTAARRSGSSNPG